MALRINHDDAGKVTGVEYADAAGQRHEQKARAVAVAGNVVETTRLLFNSESRRFPDGLGNASGHLGRNYTRHVTSGIVAVMPGPVGFHKGTRQAGLIMDEQYHRPERGFAGGYLIETGSSDPLGASQNVGGCGRSSAAYIEDFGHSAGAFITGEDPPQASNRISLHPTERDGYDLAVPVLTYSMHPNSAAMQQHAIAQTKSVYESLGGTRVIASEGVGTACHNMGVARMSADPDDGVTNRWGQVHDVPNLFV